METDLSENISDYLVEKKNLNEKIVGFNALIHDIINKIDDNNRDLKNTKNNKLDDSNDANSDNVNSDNANSDNSDYDDNLLENYIMKNKLNQNKNEDEDEDETNIIKFVDFKKSSDIIEESEHDDKLEKLLSNYKKIINMVEKNELKEEPVQDFDNILHESNDLNSLNELDKNSLLLNLGKELNSPKTELDFVEFDLNQIQNEEDPVNNLMQENIINIINHSENKEKDDSNKNIFDNNFDNNFENMIKVVEKLNEISNNLTPNENLKKLTEQELNESSESDKLIDQDEKIYNTEKSIEPIESAESVESVESDTDTNIKFLNKVIKEIENEEENKEDKNIDQIDFVTTESKEENYDEDEIVESESFITNIKIYENNKYNLLKNMLINLGFFKNDEYKKNVNLTDIIKIIENIEKKYIDYDFF